MNRLVLVLLVCLVEISCLTNKRSILTHPLKIERLKKLSNNRQQQRQETRYLYPTKYKQTPKSELASGILLESNNFPSLLSSKSYNYQPLQKYFSPSKYEPNLSTYKPVESQIAETSLQSLDTNNSLQPSVSSHFKKFNYPFNKPYDPNVKFQETTTNKPPVLETPIVTNHTVNSDEEKYQKLISSKLSDVLQPQDSFKYSKAQPSRILDIYNSFQQTPAIPYFNPYARQAAQNFQAPNYYQLQAEKLSIENLKLIQSLMRQRNEIQKKLEAASARNGGNL